MSIIILRRARNEDLQDLQLVEEGATPGLSYLADVYEMFMADDGDDLTVAECDGRLVACGKYSRMPDGSAWLETLRVLPEYQGRGIGKKFYEKFFESADKHGINTMRMYTGRTNVVSKGLAERFGFRLAGTFSIAKFQLDGLATHDLSWRQILDEEQAVEICRPYLSRWGKLITYNRTFFSPDPAVIGFLSRQGLVYSDGENVVIAGARFQPWLSNFLLAYGGDAQRCLAQAVRLSQHQKAKTLICIFPSYQSSIRNELLAFGFVLESAELIVEEWHR